MSTVTTDDDIEAGQLWWLVPINGENSDDEPIAAMITRVHRDGSFVYSVDVRRESDGVEVGFWRVQARGQTTRPTELRFAAHIYRPPEWRPPRAGEVHGHAAQLVPEKPERKPQEKA